MLTTILIYDSGERKKDNKINKYSIVGFYILEGFSVERLDEAFQ